MLKIIGGGILIAFGALMLLGVAVNFSESGLDAGDIVGGLLFGVGPLAGGGLLIRSRMMAKRKALQAKARDLYVQREKEVIRLAQSSNGRISIPDIVAGTSMSSDEAEKVMQEMTTKGYVDMQVTDAGVIVYEFYEIVHRSSLNE